MKTLSLEKMEGVNGGKCHDGAVAVLNLYSGGVGYVVGVVNPIAGFVVGFGLAMTMHYLCKD